MPLPRSNTADKFIVDRRKPHRNSDVARAVRRARDSLAQQPGGVVFDRDLIRQHARAMSGSVIAIPLLVLLIASALLFAGLGHDVLVWALVTVACYVGVALAARRADRDDTGHLDVSGTRRIFLAAHFVSGLGWAWFARLGCG